jgi:rare lipoprotein A
LRGIFFLFLVHSSILLLASCATHDKYVASWYGSEFHGKPTSSGEIFNMHAFTCAHREYPFGTILQITNVANNKTVKCVVNDRGPFVSGRDVDLSYAAANEIGLVGKGTSTVGIEYIGRDSSYIKEVRYLSDAGPFTIQVGSFREVANSARLKTALELKYHQVYVTEKDIGGQRYYRVRIGTFQRRSDAYRLAKTLAEEGYSIFVVGYDGKL